MRFGIFIYDSVEPIDLATFGMLSMAQRIRAADRNRHDSSQSGLVALSNSLRVFAEYGIDNAAPACDVVIVTGGPGWVKRASAPATLDYLGQLSADALIASVCSGAMNR
jgi:transcriptional regulator GlxA family with amidase domain